MSQQSQSESKRCKSTTDIVDGIVPNNNDDDFLEAFRTHPTTRQLEQEQVLQNESKSPISLANPMSPFPHQSLSSNDNGDPDYIVDDNERDVLEESPMQPPPLPFCSVLNTVVDYCMMPPTSLFELQEFRQQQNDLIGSSVSRIQVPVLRIFGPIVRRLWKDNDTVHGTGNEKVTTPPRSLGTVQSACLYIHGAYPYVLARPVAAGPDGTGHDQCPWDTAASVQRMIAVLTETMETVLQETNASFLEPSSNSTAAPLRIIRQINVVTGRGFYTYCPGPAAPFLRVEYYNPSDRWKVKRCLEHGLSDLPVSTYFPLQRHPSAPAADDDLILKFHCYEAHIPFTMQFFKDWNLAGLSYIHIASNNTATFSNTNSESISGARFRTPLPNLIRSSVTTWHHQPSTLRHGHDKNNGETVAAEQRTRLAFLASNTPSEYLSGKCGHDSWMQSFSNAHRPINHSAVGPTNLKSSTTTDSTSQTETNLQKRTSCDVELDIHVSSILNVLEVMTDLPDEWEAKQQIHWRAVPSLKEIWSQERRRMAKLLRPQHNFLSDSEKSDQAPPFTLNVKKDASLSGAVLARQGMERLVNVTDGLEINFRRVMKQIVERHEAILESDDVLKKRKMAHLQRNSVPSCNPLSPVIDNDKFSDGQNLTPSYDETMEALHSLGNIRQGSSSTPNDSEYCNVDRRNYFSTSQNCSPTPTPTQSSKLLNDQLLLSLSQACASQSFANSTTLDSLRDEFRLSQRVERGDGIVDCHFECMDEVIDPETLVPFETFDDEEEEDNDSFGESCEVDESRIEQILSSLATQSYMSTTKPLENNNLLLDEDSSVDSFTLLSGTRNKEILFDPEECNDRHSPGATASPQISAREENRHEHVSEPQTDYFHWDHHPNVFIECRTPPPTRGDAIELTRGTGLLPMQLQGHPPPWANFLSEYEATRNEMRPRTWFPFIGTKGVDVLPVITAPAQKEVVNWIKRNSRRRHPVDEIENNIQKSHFLNSKKARKAPSESKIDIVQIEHVDWNLSQESSVSTMTKSLNDTVDGISQSSTTLGFQATGLLNEHNQSGSIEPTVTFSTPFDSSTQDSALQGMGNQGGRLLVEGGGHLKTKHTQSNIPAAVLSIDSMDSFPCPVSIMSIEVYVQCRTGRAGVNDSKTIALTPSSDRDKVCSIVYVLCRDPGGGVPFEFLERGCIFTPLERELEQTTHGLSFCCQQLVSNIRKSMPPRSFGVNSPLTIECVRDERQLLLRFASIVRLKDPDMLLSWDTQGAGLGFVIERGMAVGKNAGEIQSPSAKIDMARLLGRTPTVSSRSPGPGDQAFDSADAGSEALEEMSRSVANKERKVQESSPTWKGSGLGTEWDERVGAGAAAASISGRLVFSAWKIVAEEVKHPNYSYLPAIVALVLSKRIPHIDNLRLAEWYGHLCGRERWRVFNHLLSQAVASLQLFDALDIIGRSGEAARLSGVEFSQSFPGIRGSQYKVEGVLLRALKSLNSEERGSKRGRRRTSQNTGKNASLTTDSKSQSQSPWKTRRHANKLQQECDSTLQSLHNLSERGYFFFSPSLQDTTKQEALEVQALTLEPKSGHLTDPVVVCDFTALYPSLVIGYNLCYSTCAGRFDYHTTRNEMRLDGKTTGKVGPMQYAENITAAVLKYHVKSLTDEKLKGYDRAYTSPNGALFVSETVVKGVLPQVLDEMLSTRAMLKKAAKQYKKQVPDLSPAILRQLEARQLALKYVANVIYGYTSATFSGRCAMPLLADSIVECGRRTLSSAIRLAELWSKELNGKWAGVEVIYGDTDSIFMKLPGRSVAEAFQFGEEFCKAVTESNPPPVQLKLEKVYLGSMMQTKKKYCGMKFEAKDQRRPTFEAKGIETIRRDQCALTQKVLRNSLVTLYRAGIDAVKSYLQRQWTLILSGSLPVSDFILTGRVRSRYRGGRIGPVQAALSRRLAEADPAKIVRHKERQAYVIVATPGVAFKLRDCVLTPMELLEQWDAYGIHFAYYITKHLNAALQRCFGLAPYFVDVSTWFDACPKPRRRIHFWPSTRSKQNTIMISSIFGSDKCALCGKKCMAKSRSRAAVCSFCRHDSVHAGVSTMTRLKENQALAHSLAQKCSKCNLCFEDSQTFASVRSTGAVVSGGILTTPLANCSCIDCPVTYERHQAREQEIEALAICDALDLEVQRK